MIVLEMKCPPKQARGDSGKERNSIGDRMEQKPWEKPGSVGGQFPSGQTNQFCSNCSKVSVSGPLVPGVFPRWMSRWRGPHWRSVSGAHLCVLDPLTVRAVEVVSRCWSSIYGRLWLSQYNRWWLASSEVLRGVVIVSSQVFGHLRSFKGWIQTEACVIPRYHGMLIDWQYKIVRCIIWMLG